MWGMIENRRMRFALIDQAKNDFASLGKVPPALSSPALKRLCNVLGVSQSGYFAYCGRNASARRRDDMVNPIRRHSGLDYLSPVQFEQRAAS